MDTFCFVLYRVVVLFQRLFSIECVYNTISTFGSSFIGRFVLFWSVLYQRYHYKYYCNTGLQMTTVTYNAALIERSAVAKCLVEASALLFIRV